MYSAASGSPPAAVASGFSKLFLFLSRLPALERPSSPSSRTLADLWNLKNILITQNKSQTNNENVKMKGLITYLSYKLQLYTKVACGLLGVPA